MSKNDNREVISETIVESMMDGIMEKRDKWPWYKRLAMKIKWRFEELSYWWRKKRQIWQTGFPHEESWDFHRWHSKMVVPRLKYLRDNLQGAPSTMFPDDYDHKNEWKMDKKDREIAFERAKNRWYDTITKIIWAFEHCDDLIDPIKPDDYDARYKMQRLKDGGLVFDSMDDRELDYTPQKEHDKKVDEGLELFAKYYKNLWD